jgi:hypothetical protein
MSELDALYARLLQLGFIVMKLAADRQDHEWLEAEMAMLHNVPSLLVEPNAKRHEYYWRQERQAYINWVNAPGREEAKSRMLTFYEPIWRDMEPLLADMLQPQETTTG